MILEAEGLGANFLLSFTLLSMYIFLLGPVYQTSCKPWEGQLEASGVDLYICQTMLFDSKHDFLEEVSLSGTWTGSSCLLHSS